MATLTTDRDPKYSPADLVRQYKCGVDIIYGGCIVVIDTTSSGYAFDGTAPAADLVFAGIAMESVDNSGGSAGDKSVRVWTTGEFEFTIAATADQTYVGQAAYLLTNHEVQLAPGQFGIYIGQITELISTTKVRVRIDTSLAEGTMAGAILNAGTTTPMRVYVGEGAFTTTATTAAVTAGGLTIVLGGFVTPVIDAGAAAANGQLGFTEATTTGQPEVATGDVTVNRIAGTDSGLKFTYVLFGY